MTVLSCLMWRRCERSRLDRQTGAFCVRSVSGGAVRPPDALRRRTHLSGRLIRHRQVRLVFAGRRRELGITARPHRPLILPSFAVKDRSDPTNESGKCYLVTERRRNWRKRVPGVGQRDGRGSIFLHPTQPNPPITHLREMQTPVL